MLKKLMFILLVVLLISACKEKPTIIDNNMTNDINNISDNLSSDNISIPQSISDSTIIDFFINKDGEKVTKIYKSYPQNIKENKENDEILQLLLEYSDNKCINWIADALKLYNINDNIADTFIIYKNIDLYEPSALHIAVLCGDINVINLMIYYGANVFALDDAGVSVLSLAEKINNEEIINIITREY